MMRNKQQLITYAYHFVSEAIIIFLIVIPLLHLEYEFIPYWEYLILIVGLSILFTLFAFFTSTYALYIISTPFIASLLFLLGFSFVISIILSVAFIWRAIILRRYIASGFTDVIRENRYLLITFTLAFVLFLTMKSNEVVIYSLLQLFLLIIGYIGSNVVAIGKEERKQVDRKLPFYLFAFVIVSILFIFPLFHMGRTALHVIWQGFTYVLILISSQAFRLLEFVSPFLHDAEFTEDESYQMQEEGQLGRVEGAPLISEVGPYLYWAIFIVALCLIIYIAMRIFTKRFKHSEDEQQHNVVSSEKSKASKGNNGLRHLFRNLFQRPEHPARKLVYDFEKKLVGTSRERYAHETLEAWSRRIGLPSNLEIYQKVRYGNISISNEELFILQEQLEEFYGAINEE